MTIRRLLLLGILVLGTGLLVYGLHVPIQNGPTISDLLDPADGLFRTARAAPVDAESSRLVLPSLDAPVTVVRDDRYVPHIYAESDRDATIALGYVVAKDRLFQLDFIPRVASGRLSEAIGPQALEADQFLRRTGMEWGAQKTLESVRERGDVGFKALRWYGHGANAYLDHLDRADLPLEFRLLGYAPDRYTPIQAFRLLQYMNYDLTYNSDDPAYTQLRDELGASTFDTLYPEHPAGLFVPIVPPQEQLTGRSTEGSGHGSSSGAASSSALKTVLAERRAGQQSVADLIGETGGPSTGSNNWAVNGGHSATGAPLLAGDMHLSLSLPSIWYEAHLVTPSMNAYGLTIPGAPVLVQAFNEHVGWTMTNTGADQIDYYALTVDRARSRYQYDGEWHPLQEVVDTIHVKGAAPVLDTVHFSHHGPVHFGEAGEEAAIAEQWVAHKPSHTLEALWDMNRATSLDELTDAMRQWDTPMQNLLRVGREDTIAIRATGHLPVRRAGHGRGLLDGTSGDHAWVGRVPFDSLPAARNPSQGFLASANQKPTGPEYPYYLGHDWGDGYRSMRIDSLLGGSQTHSVADFQRYQADVEVQQREVFVPFLRELEDLSPRADTLRRMLDRWDGRATVDAPEPLVMDEFLSLLRTLMWDEPVFATGPDPEDAPLVNLLRTAPDARWFDIQATEPVEDADGLLRHVLEATADTMAAEYGWSPGTWRWGDHHELRIRHLSESDQLRSLGRGPYEYPGFAETLSPARGRTVTHSASQRVVVDFSTSPPTGYGVYPGGQRGDPLDPAFYDDQIPTYLDFEYYPLWTPARPSALADSVRHSTVELVPGS